MKQTDDDQQNEGNAETGGLQKHRKFLLPGLAILAAIAVIFGIDTAQRNSKIALRTTDTQAGCYGYSCQPYVNLGGRVSTVKYGSSLSYGTLYVKKGAKIELSWIGENIDFCKAEWTKENGTYLPPTRINEPINKDKQFTVGCYRKGSSTVYSTLNVVVNK